MFQITAITRNNKRSVMYEHRRHTNYIFPSNLFFHAKLGSALILPHYVRGRIKKGYYRRTVFVELSKDEEYFRGTAHR